MSAPTTHPGLARLQAISPGFRIDPADLAHRPCDACTTQPSCTAAGCCMRDEAEPVAAMVRQPVQQPQANAGKAGAKPKQTIRGGFIVHRRGDSSSKLMTPPSRQMFEHPTLEAATAEAQRLAERHGREFAVFREVAAAKPIAGGVA